MSGVEPGSIIVCEYVKEKDKYAMEGEFWNFQLFQYTDPILERKLIVKSSADKTLYYKVRNGDLSPEIKQQDNEKIYTWKQTNIPAIIKENNMPSLINVAPFVQVSTVKNWSQVSNWYQDLIEEQYQVNEELKSKIKELTENVTKTEEKIKALFYYVTNQIRYIGLQFGESGYKPYSAVETFKNKYGVCKEKATLLIAMLREIGVKAEPVLIYRGSATIDIEIASPGLFNHMIVYLPEQKKYLDPTSQGTRYGVLPGDQGKNVLLPEIDKLSQTPVRPPECSTALVNQKVKLKEDGSADINYKEKYTGLYGFSYKQIYKSYTPRQRKRLIRSGVSRGFSNAYLKGIKLEGVEKLNKVFSLQVSNIKVPAYAKSMGDNLLSFKFLHYPIQLNQLVASQTRNYPLYLGFKRKAKRKIEVVLPVNFKVKFLPEDINYSNKVGKLSVDYQKQNNILSLDFEIIIDKQQIGVEDYQAARELFNKAGAVIDKQVLIVKKQ